MHTIIVKPPAEDDLDGIFRWYETQREGLGYEFLLNTDECINTIQSNPYSHLMLLIQ